MDTPHSLFGLVFLRQFLAACGRLWAIAARSRPWHGFPIHRAYLDFLEALSHDPAPDYVAPSLSALLDAIEERSPGVTHVVLRARGPDRPARRGLVGDGIDDRG